MRCFGQTLLVSSNSRRIPEVMRPLDCGVPHEAMPGIRLEFGRYWPGWPERGVGQSRRWRQDRLGCRRAIAERGMRSHGIVVLATAR